MNDLLAQYHSCIKEILSQVPESLQSETVREEMFAFPIPFSYIGWVLVHLKWSADMQDLKNQDQRVNIDRLRAELPKELQAEFGGRLTHLECKCERLQTHMEYLGYPMPQYFLQIQMNLPQLRLS